MEGRMLLATVLCVLNVHSSYEDGAFEPNLSEELSHLKKKLDILERRLSNDISHNTPDHKGLSKHHKLKGDNRIGFTASLSHSIDSLAAKQLIPFDKVTSNLGNTYNNATGVYTCPLAGNYFFSCSVTNKLGTMIQATILMDGSPIASMYADSGSSQSMSQGSNSAVTHCNMGQQVAVRVDRGNSIYGDMTSPLTSFTGFLIWDD